ncbi:NUDIX hydrolase [Cellulomonas bogoriensis]|uniref:NUDIX hydrolase n=1 Tax=Cellulomonas bogoriensis 69B4 = DSM 16987 TaxID=1386082 RepID=A0A0A0BLV0_9CELL|nr:NUDIX hydrolase [Cellulomonas bogoriensis]KGM08941.1 NUDIX hydrolase [Cellulomonas bogoriensis 69B4 = DSM 16987]
MPRPPGRHHRQPGDGWVECGCGARHWGLHGAAGLLLHRPEPAGTGPGHVVLQHRALWSHHGGTWGIPGGAIAPHETPEQGAVREAQEEAGIDPGHLTVLTTSTLTHPDWAYTTVVARTTGTQHPRPTDDESLEIAWVHVDDVADLPLLPAFATAWPDLRAALTT